MGVVVGVEVGNGVGVSVGAVVDVGVGVLVGVEVGGRAVGVRDKAASSVLFAATTVELAAEFTTQLLLKFCDKTGKKARRTLKNEQRQHNKPAKSAIC